MLTLSLTQFLFPPPPPPISSYLSLSPSLSLLTPPLSLAPSVLCLTLDEKGPDNAE